MASVTIVQPAVGKVTGGNYGTGQFTVTWSSQVVEDEFIEFRLYCHACNKTIQSSSSNPAVFDIAGLENSGHPGPFEITAVVLGAWTNVTIETTVAEGAGTVSPKTQTIRARRGSKITFSINASPAEGWQFEKWTGWGESTSANVAITTTVEGVNPTYIFRAHFKVRTYLAKFEGPIGGLIKVGDRQQCENLDNLAWGKEPDLGFPAIVTAVSEEVLIYFFMHRTPDDGKSEAEKHFTVGDTLYIYHKPQRQDVIAAWRIKILGYQIKYSDHTEFIQGEDVAFKPGADNILISPVVTACYGVKNLLLQVFSKAPKAALNVKSENSYSVIEKQYDKGGNIIGMIIVTGPGAVIDIGGKLLDGDYYIHGYSHNLEDLPEASGYKWKRLVMPAEPTTVTVYVCTDALLYGSHEDLLHTNENALAYGCYVPEGQTVYP